MEIMRIAREEGDVNYGTVRLDNYEITLIGNALYQYSKERHDANFANLYEEWKVFQCLTSYGRVIPNLCFPKKEEPTVEADDE